LRPIKTPDGDRRRGFRQRLRLLMMPFGIGISQKARCFEVDVSLPCLDMRRETFLGGKEIGIISWSPKTLRVSGITCKNISPGSGNLTK